MRYDARHLGSGVWGVWDRGTSSWVGTGLGETEARQQAMDLDVVNGTYGQRPGSDRREVRPPVTVDVCVWAPAGELDWWVRERHRWWGRVRDGDGRLRWLRGDRLRLHRDEHDDGPDPGG